MIPYTLFASRFQPVILNCLTAAHMPLESTLPSTLHSRFASFQLFLSSRTNGGRKTEGNWLTEVHVDRFGDGGGICMNGF